MKKRLFTLPPKAYIVNTAKKLCLFISVCIVYNCLLFSELKAQKRSDNALPRNAKMPKAAYISKISPKNDGGSPCQTVVNVTAPKDVLLWDHGRIPYTIEPAFNENERRAIRAGANEWTRGTDGRITIYEMTADELAAAVAAGSNYVIVKLDNSNCNKGNIGANAGTEQPTVRLCSGQPAAKVTHEFGHIIGLWHEHQRADRDNYLVTHPEVYNCFPASLGDFNIISNQHTIGVYDTSSIMHYSSLWNRPQPLCEDNITPNIRQAVSIFEWRATGDRIIGTNRASQRDFAGVVELYNMPAGIDPFVPLATVQEPLTPPDMNIISGVPISFSSPAVTSQSPGSLNLFVLGRNGHIYHRWHDRQLGPDWSVWEDLGEGFVSSPSAVSWGTGRVDIVASKNDKKVYWRSYNNNQWQPWVEIGYPVTGTAGGFVYPAITSTGTGNLEVFVTAKTSRTNSELTLWRTSYRNGSWNSWNRCGGKFLSPPSAIGLSDGTIHVVGVGLNQNIWDLYYDGRSWSQSDIGGLVRTDRDARPAIALWGNDLHVWVTGRNSMLWNNVCQNGRWLGWGNFGGNLRNSPSAVAWGDEVMYIFANIENSGLWYKRWRH